MFQERNWILGVRQRQQLEIELRPLEPLPALRLELG
ncbi:MAG: DUF3153 domain-containing protein, partial [Synechococcaceae cyanobacterium]